jgi:hypothetical protein
MSEPLQSHCDIDGIAADALAIHRRQIAGDAIIPDRGDSGSHALILIGDVFVVAPGRQRMIAQMHEMGRGTLELCG